MKRFAQFGLMEAVFNKHKVIANSRYVSSSQRDIRLLEMTLHYDSFFHCWKTRCCVPSLFYGRQSTLTIYRREVIK